MRRKQNSKLKKKAENVEEYSKVEDLETLKVVRTAKVKNLLVTKLLKSQGLFPENWEMTLGSVPEIAK